MFLFLFDQRSAAVFVGSLAAFMLDPALAIAGIIVGFIGKNYKQFCLVAYPAAIAVAVITTIIFVNPWQQKVSGHNVEAWVYIFRAFAVIFIAHIIHAGKTEFMQKRLKT